jgi:Bacteriophage T4-like capsid assembly protein (Gp20).
MGAQAKDNQQLIIKYRGVSHHPEVDAAIEDIVNESIVGSEGVSCEINLDKVDAKDNIKKQMTEEFNNIYSMMKFSELGHDIFRSFYVDGRVVFHLVVNESNMKAGIQEIRPIDAAKIRKVKEVKYKKDPATGAKVVDRVNEFYLFQEKGWNESGCQIIHPTQYPTPRVDFLTRQRNRSCLIFIRHSNQSTN